MLIAALALCVCSEEVVITSEHFRLTTAVDDSEGLEEVIGDLEQLWSNATELFGYERSTDELIDIFFYDTAEAYQLAEQELTQGAFATNYAFSHYNTKSSHVSLQPPSSAAALRRIGIPKLSRKLLVHEAAHAFFYGLYRNYRSFPDWWAEGYATWLAVETGVDRGWMDSRSEDPNSSTRAGLALNLLESDRMPSVDALLLGELDGLARDEKYACYELFFRYLMETSSETKKVELFSEARRLGGGKGFGEELKKVVEGIFGKPSRIDAKFRRYLKKIKPVWQQLFRSLETSGEEWVHSAYPDKNAVAWRTQEPRRSKYVISGSVELVPGKRTQLNLLLDRRKEGPKRGLVSIAFLAGYGVTVFEFLPETKGWVNLTDKEVPGFVPGEAIDFEVAVSGNKISLSMGGALVLTLQISGRDLGGPWGLGAQSGSTGIWRLKRAPGLN